MGSHATLGHQLWEAPFPGSHSATGVGWEEGNPHVSNEELASFSPEPLMGGGMGTLQTQPFRASSEVRPAASVLTLGR